jgi:hypothetical protein
MFCSEEMMRERIICARTVVTQKEESVNEYLMKKVPAALMPQTCKCC